MLPWPGLRLPQRERGEYLGYAVTYTRRNADENSTMLIENVILNNPPDVVYNVICG